MKKIVFTLAALMSMTLAFAEGENTNENNAAVAAEAAKYDFNINVKSLSNTLKLDNEEAYTVSLITKNFADDMRKAGAAKDEEQAKLYKKALNRNLSYMHSVLTERQYREYVKLLNVTLVNRGLSRE